MFVVVVGGGRVGSGLVKLLQADGHEVSLIERDRGRFEDLFREYGEVVRFGDGSDAGVLKDAGANRADVVAAVCDRDEDNLVVCQLVKLLFMMPKTIARVTNPQNERMFSAVGVDATVNSTRLINSLIGEKVRASEVMPLLPLRGDMEVVEVRLSEKSPLVGKKAAKVQLPKGTRVVAFARGERIFLPDEDEILAAEDQMFAVARREDQDGLRKFA